MAGRVRALARRSVALRRAVLRARFGDVGRTAPLTTSETDRGTPIDRWYIERYLTSHAADVSGLVLEVKSDGYASRFGAANVDVVDIDPSNSRATVVGDLCDPATLASGRYDAAIVTQTLQYLVVPAAGIRNLAASLRPGGVLLLTVPCVSRLYDPGDRWRWTPTGLRELLIDAVPAGSDIEVIGMGNALAGRAFLFGLAAEDLVPTALSFEEDDCPLIICARVRVPG